MVRTGVVIASQLFIKATMVTTRSRASAKAGQSTDAVHEEHDIEAHASSSKPGQLVVSNDVVNAHGPASDLNLPDDPSIDADMAEQKSDSDSSADDSEEENESEDEVDESEDSHESSQSVDSSEFKWDNLPGEVKVSPSARTAIHLTVFERRTGSF